MRLGAERMELEVMGPGVCLLAKVEEKEVFSPISY